MPRTRFHTLRWLLPFVLALSSAGVSGCALLGIDADGWLSRVVEPGRSVDSEAPLSPAPEPSAALARLLPLQEDSLAEIVTRVGARLARYTLTRPYEYRFYVLDEAAPNSFSLPKGHIYVTRGLLAQLVDEDELALVLAHELAHAAERKVPDQLEMAPDAFPLALPGLRFDRLRANEPQTEREADRRAQRIARAAGYDPWALVGWLERSAQLAASSEEEGPPRSTVRAMPPWPLTHPSSEERQGLVRAFAAKLGEESTPPAREAAASAFLALIDGLPLGTSVAAGEVRAGRLLHARLGVALDLPEGWEPVLDVGASGARTPDGRSLVFVREEALREGVPSSVDAQANQLRRELGARFDMSVGPLRPCVDEEIDCWRFEIDAKRDGLAQQAELRLARIDGRLLRVMAVAPRRDADEAFRVGRLAAASLRPIGDGPRLSTVLRLRTVRARAGETLEQAATRFGAAAPAGQLAALNGVSREHRFAEGQLVKLVRLESLSTADYATGAKGAKGAKGTKGAKATKGAKGTAGAATGASQVGAGS